MKILVLNGPNLNLLGTREPGVYGTDTLADVIARVRVRASALDVDVDDFQGNDEGALVSRIHAARGQCDGIIMNPGAYTHTSLALRDALQACEIPCVEVHLSNVYARESFRWHSLTAPACVGQISGLGPLGYELALEALVARARERA